MGFSNKPQKDRWNKHQYADIVKGYDNEWN